jgi:hypothetical protein
MSPSCLSRPPLPNPTSARSQSSLQLPIRCRIRAIHVVQHSGHRIGRACGGEAGVRASGPAGLQRTRRKRTAVRRAAASLAAVRGRATLRAFRRISPWVRKRTKLSISRPAAPRFPPATLHASEVDAPLLSRPTAARFLPHLSVGRAADAPPHGTVNQGSTGRAGNRGHRHRRRARPRPDAASARSAPIGSATSAAARRQGSRRAMPGCCQPHPFERPAPPAQTSGSAPF